MSREQSYTYTIQVQYHIGDDWIAAWSLTQLTRAFSTSGTPISTLVVLVQDQAKLMGLLNDIHGHGMRLLSVRALNQSHTSRSRLRATPSSEV